TFPYHVATATVILAERSLQPQQHAGRFPNTRPKRSPKPRNTEIRKSRNGIVSFSWLCHPLHFLARSDFRRLGQRCAKHVLRREPHTGSQKFLSSPDAGRTVFLRLVVHHCRDKAFVLASFVNHFLLRSVWQPILALPYCECHSSP